MKRRFEIGLLAVVLLVLLRLALGWHFLYEGYWKWKHPEWSAAGFFRQARGPFAHHFHRLLPDYDGRNRLDKQWVFSRWQAQLQQAIDHYGFDEKQQQAARKLLQLFEKQLDDFFAENEAEINQYLEALQKWRQEAESPAGRQVPYLQERLHRRWQELQQQAAPLLGRVDKMMAAFGRELEALATPEQRAARGPLPRPVETIDRIDQATRWLLVLVGLGLMLGLFTRLAALGGAAFLLLVVLAQPALPGVYPPPHPSQGHAIVVNKDFIEMLTLLFVAATPVGRWAGLDFVLYHGLCARCCRGGKEKTQEKKDK